MVAMLSTFHRGFISVLALGLWLMPLLSILSAHAEPYRLEYHVTLLPKKDMAEVRIEIHQPHKISMLDFNLAKSTCSEFNSNSEIQLKKQRLLWAPNQAISYLKYRCPINNLRPSKKKGAHYDALITSDWALFRGDDLVPPAKVRQKKGWQSQAKLFFSLPRSWPAVNTEWQRQLDATPSHGGKNASVFMVDNPARKFDRPTGWIIAGKIATRRLKFETSDHVSRIAVSAPKGSSMRRMDILTFAQFVWPHFEDALGTMPNKLLIVGADDPMWRGGLSAGNSLYLHAERPIISENGTSTLLHELFHMATGIRGKPKHDWIAEGLAEYYSIKILRRAGGLNEDRYARTLKSLARWAEGEKSLYARHSKAANTAAAALLFKALDEEIQTINQQQQNLDNLVRLLIGNGRVDLEDLKLAFTQITGQKSHTLQSPLLKK